MMTATGTPFGRTPVVSSFLMSASLQAPIPLSLSEVMFDAVTSKGGSSKRMPPDSALSSIRPFGPRGVWQLWQVITVSTRYLPRSTLAPDCGLALKGDDLHFEMSMQEGLLVYSASGL